MPPSHVSRTVAATGAAFAVGIGYMDPGNWSTDFNATVFQDALLWSILASGAAAMLVQSLVVRLATDERCDLATQILERWPHASAWLWPVYVFSIIATETAEFTGVTLGLQLVFHIGLGIAAVLAALAFFAILAVRATAARPLEILTIVTTLVLAGLYAVGWAMLHPAAGPVLRGAFIPTLPGHGALLAVIGIVGATIMPHNLFLQSGIICDNVKDAAREEASRIRVESIRQTIVALTVATAINAMILVVGNAEHATEIEGAFRALVARSGWLGGACFGGALALAGLAAAATGARAGDFIFQAGAPLRIPPTTRRVASIVPAAILLGFGVAPNTLLVFSQVALGLALPFVLVPLLMLVFNGAVKRTASGVSLLGATSLVVLLTLACDGIFLVSLFGH